VLTIRPGPEILEEIPAQSIPRWRSAQQAFPVTWAAARADWPLVNARYSKREPIPVRPECLRAWVDGQGSTFSQGEDHLGKGFLKYGGMLAILNM
jgi:hypothetical protein